MICGSDYIIRSFYRSLVREICKCPLDKVTKQRLHHNVHKRFSHKFKMLGSDKSALHIQLEEGKCLLNKLKSVTNSRNPDAIKSLLKLSYISSPSLKARCPRWLSDFLLCKSIGKRKKEVMLQNYGGILKFKHVMDKFSLDAGMKKTYYDSFAKKMADSTPTSQPIELIFNNVKHPLQTESIQGEITDDVHLLAKFRNEFDKRMETKLKIPSLTISLLPTRFGEPLPKVRLVNIMMSRLINIQRFFLHYSPISIRDMTYLDNLNDNGFFDFHQDLLRGYKLFTEDCYAVTDDANILTSQMNNHIYIMPHNLCSMFEEDL